MRKSILITKLITLAILFTSCEDVSNNNKSITGTWILIKVYNKPNGDKNLKSRLIIDTDKKYSNKSEFGITQNSGTWLYLDDEKNYIHLSSGIFYNDSKDFEILTVSSDSLILKEYNALNFKENLTSYLFIRE